jgi:pSer/pThr/pTyr-binding forkhead associated (FHA) protein
VVLESNRRRGASIRGHWLASVEETMEAKLVVVNGKSGHEEFQLELPTIIGRSRSANVPIGHPLVSRQHCELYEEDGVLMVRDLGSLNGTYIDDMRLAEEAVALRPGRRLTVGPTTFKAVYHAPVDAEDDDEIEFDEADAGADTAVIEQTSEAPKKSSAAAAADVEDEEVDEAHLNPPAGARDQDFDLGWLSDDAEEAAAEPAAEVNKSEAETENVPDAADFEEQADEEDAADEGEDEEEEEEEKPEPKKRFFWGKKAAKPEPEKAKPEKAPPAKGKGAKPITESAETVMFTPSHSDTHDFTPAEKSGGHGDEPEEGENLDDFFDTLK